MDHFKHGIIGFIVTFTLANHIITLNPAIADKLVNIVVSLLAGIISSFVSKLISFYYNRNSKKSESN